MPKVGWLFPFFLVCALPALRAGEPFEAVTDKEIEAIEYDDAVEDNGFVTPLAENLEHLEGDSKKDFDEFAGKFEDWKPGQEEDLTQKVRNWICLATLSDVAHGQFEREAPYAIFERLKRDIPREKLIKATAWIVLKPDLGTVLTEAPDLGLEGAVDETVVRERAQIYAKKLLGRLLGKLPPKE